MSRLLVAWPWLFLAGIGGFIAWDFHHVRSAMVVATPGETRVEAWQRDPVSPTGGGGARGEPGRLPCPKQLGQPPVARDPVCRMTVRRASAHSVAVGSESYYFCSTYCRDEFLERPARFRSLPGSAGGHTMRGIPTWMYQVGLAVILLVSFGFFELLSWRAPRRTDTPTLDLLAWRPLRELVRSRSVRFVLQLGVTAAFLGVIVAGLFGNQNPAMNIAPLLTWTVWWVGLVFLVLFFGKAWCSVCPWDALATWVETLRPWGPRRGGLGLGLPWPSRLRNIWLAVALFLVLTWIELGLGITQVPRATALVGLGMLSLALVSVLVFDRKSFCRYGCLVGRVSGLYAMFTGMELRPRDPSVCRDCRSADCYRGNEHGDGCPTFEFPKTMTRNTYCILCTECLQTCPSDNITLKLRPWGADLVAPGRPRRDEAVLALVLLSMTAFHGLTMTPTWPVAVAGARAATGLAEAGAFALLMALCLLVSILAYGAAALLSARLGTRPVGTIFLHYAYAMLPIALFYHLAHNAEHFLIEGPKLIPLLSDPMGRGWDLLGTAGWTAVPLVTMEGLWVIQVTFVIVGHLYSLWISEGITRRLVGDRRRGFAVQVPMLAAMILFSALSLWLLNQPMEMRLSAM